MFAAPSRPYRSSSLASECATVTNLMPLPALSASIDGRSTGHTWATSSMAISSGGSSRPAAVLLPARPAS